MTYLSDKKPSLLENHDVQVSQVLDTLENRPCSPKYNYEGGIPSLNPQEQHS